MTSQIRVRFAPSPTGALHIGGVRTALFNYLFAKKHHGIFYLRVEDTDQNRFVDGAEQYILDALEWLGIPPDETVNKNEQFGPYRQSERKEIYHKYVQQLVSTGHAYYAFDSAESLDLHRKKYESEGKTFIYNWHNREQMDTSLVLSEQETMTRIKTGAPFVIRFKTPINETLHLHDLIRGDIQFETNLLDDKVLFKSDGMPTYHLANVVDDFLMQTSHVIRGEEWLPSMPLHVMLYQAFGWNAPKFAHLPLILKPSGKGKLSKRDGELGGFPVFPMAWNGMNGFQEEGYFPDALLNFLALIGWNDGTNKEIFSLSELVDAFDLKRVHKSGARFDIEKAKSVNHHYMQFHDLHQLAQNFIPIIESHVAYKIDNENNLTQANTNSKASFTHKNVSYVCKIIEKSRHKATFVNDLWQLNDYFFIAPQAYDEKAVQKVFKNDNKEPSKLILKQFAASLFDFSYDSSEGFQQEIKIWFETKELLITKFMPLIRLSLVGEMKGIDVHDIIFLLGAEETKNRIKKALLIL